MNDARSCADCPGIKHHESVPLYEASGFNLAVSLNAFQALHKPLDTQNRIGLLRVNFAGGNPLKAAMTMTRETITHGQYSPQVPRLA